MTVSPLSREARKAETRDAIVAAARKLFATQGIEATTLDRIAGEVGLTKGAIYSTFSSKDELVEAVAREASIVVDTGVLLDPDIPLRDGLRTLARALYKAQKRLEHEGLILDLEFFLYERRHAKWGDKLMDERRTGFVEFADQLELACRERGETLPTPARHFVYGLQALALGVTLEIERDPKTFTERSVIELFAALAD
jgi:AcrR family transcriptional regulator